MTRENTGPDSQAIPWRCFHCNESFTDVDAARLHFGTSERQAPACEIDIAEYRAMEERMRRYNDEDAEIHRQMHRMGSAHVAALQREEERGYARGLRDAAKPAPLDTTTAERRLTELLVAALGPRHEAIDDLAALVFARIERDRLLAEVGGAAPAEMGTTATGLAVNGPVSDPVHAKLVELVREIAYTLEDGEGQADGSVIITSEHSEKLNELLDGFEELPFEREGCILGPASKIELALKSGASLSQGEAK